MARLAFTVTNHSLTFFIKGRPYSLTRDHENYAQARAHLQTAPDVDHDPELLVDLVDARRAIARASFGRIQFDGNEILWQGKPLHGVWVDRILEFRAAGEDHTALFNALDRLVHNPTVTAIERLPIFLDRVALPFMPDGRFLAFKGVTSSYESAHVSPDGTRFRHFVGDKPRMPREEVDANPDRTCSTGLHVGAPGYVRSHYSGGDHALVLVAVDPVDVVSVPTDYNGEKMRVCGYEVIEHLDQSYSDELFGRLRDTYLAPKSEASPSATGAELAALACVGDVVVYAGHDSDGHSGAFPAGEYEVVYIDDEAVDGSQLRVATSTHQQWLRDDNITKVIRDGVEVTPTTPTPEEDEEQSEFDKINVGDVIEYDSQFGSITYSLVTAASATTGIIVRDEAGDTTDVAEHDFTRIVPWHDVTAAMLVTKGTLVQIEGHEFLKDGPYTISGTNDEMEGADQIEDDSDFWAVTVSDRDIPIQNGNIRAANHKGEHLWPRTKVEIEASSPTVVITADGLETYSAPTVTTVDEADAYPTYVSAVAVEAPGVAGIEIGDLVEVTSGWPPVGIYPVIDSYPAGVIVQTEHDGIVSVTADRVKLHQSRPWMRAEIGGTVELVDEDGSFVPAGRFGVVDILLNSVKQQLQVRTPNAQNWWVSAARVTAAFPKA